MSEKKISDQLINELADLIQHKIHNQEFSDSVFLRQNELEKQLQVNRFTVRRVLNELTNREVLEHVPYRGHKIKVHSISERQQITEARLLLELGAATQVMNQIDSTGLSQLTLYAQHFANAIEQHDIRAQIQANYQFHAHYYSYCPNKFLCSLINELREKGIRVSKPGWFNSQASQQASEEHFQIVEALQQKDSLSLQNLIYQHLNAWRKYTTVPGQ